MPVFIQLSPELNIPPEILSLCLDKCHVNCFNCQRCPIYAIGDLNVFHLTIADKQYLIKMQLYFPIFPQEFDQLQTFNNRHVYNKSTLRND